MASGTPAQVKAKFATFGSYNWYGECAGVVMTVVNHFGVKNGSAYPSAKAAQNASKIVSTDPAKAPVGAVHHWDYFGADSAGRLGNWGHVGVDMFGGGTKVLNATAHADEKWGTNVGLGSVKGITSRIGGYKGWSTTYGTHEINLTAPSPSTPAPAPAGGAASALRTVSNPKVGHLNGRSKPNTTSGKIEQTLKSGVVGTFDGYIKGQKVTVNGRTSDIWFRGAFNGNFFAAAGFTSQSIAGLKNLGTAAAPAPAKPKKRYARLATNWYFYSSKAAALVAWPRQQWIGPGDFELVDQKQAKGPFQVYRNGKKVWVGSSKTNPPIVSK